MTKFMAIPILKILHELPYWYIILRVFNFVILAREYFAGVFFFRDFNTQIWEKSNKFRDLNILKFILFLKSLNVFKFLV